MDVKNVDSRLGWLQKQFQLSGNALRELLTKEPRIIIFGTGPIKVSLRNVFMLLIHSTLATTSPFQQWLGVWTVWNQEDAHRRSEIVFAGAGTNQENSQILEWNDENKQRTDRQLPIDFALSNCRYPQAKRVFEATQHGPVSTRTAKLHFVEEARTSQWSIFQRNRVQKIFAWLRQFFENFVNNCWVLIK